MALLMLRSLFRIPHESYHYFLARRTKSTFVIDALNLEKTYNNTHRYENSFIYESRKFLLKNNFMLFAQESKLPDNAKSLVFEYAYEEKSSDLLMQKLNQNIPIFEVIRENNIGKLVEYIQCGGDVNRRIDFPPDWHGITPLHVAVYFKQVDCLKLLLENEADLDSELKRKDGLVKPLQLAQEIGAHEIVAMISNETARRLCPTKKQRVI